jgi:YopT-type cysteine protease-like protein
MPDEIAQQTRSILAGVRLKAVPLCTYIKLFTQTPAGEAYAVLDANGQAGGICCALSLCWLEARAKGLELMDSLLGPGGTIKEEAIKPAIKMQKDMADPDTQLQQASAWLKKRGFKGKLMPTKQSNSIQGGIGTWLCQTYSEPGSYRLIGVRGGYNHAMALDMTKSSDLAFFDPNLGGFHFNSLTNLRSFLDDVVFPKGAQHPHSFDAPSGSYIGRKTFLLVELGGYDT